MSVAHSFFATSGLTYSLSSVYF